MESCQADFKKVVAALGLSRYLEVVFLSAPALFFGRVQFSPFKEYAAQLQAFLLRAIFFCTVAQVLVLRNDSS